jgi:hypothetical protein
MYYRRRLMLVFGLALGLAGCSSHLVKPKGRLVNGTTAFQCEPGEVVHITFIPAEAEPESEQEGCIARFNNDTSEFEATGKDSRGLLPGKYRVSVQVMKNRKDRFAGALSGANSPFLVEVTPHPEEIVLDVAQAGVPHATIRAEGKMPAAGENRRRRSDR